MKTLKNVCFVMALALLAVACGKGGGSGTTGPTISSGGVQIRATQNSVSFKKNDIGLGQAYIEGSCDGSDNSGQNVTSLALRPRGSGCLVSAPHSINVIAQGSNFVQIDWRIGPAATDLRTVSLPFDTPGKIFDKYCSWSGTCGKFSDIPTPHYIPPGFGFPGGYVGVVMARGDLSSGSWGEISGPYGVVRRTYLGGDCVRLLFYNHPSTNNIELGFVSDISIIALPRGQTLSCQEQISIL